MINSNGCWDGSLLQTLVQVSKGSMIIYHFKLARNK